MLLVNILLSLSALISFLLGLLIVASSPNRPVNRSLGVFLAGIFIWLTTNLATNLSSSPDWALFFARSTLLGVCVLFAGFIVFCMTFTHASSLSRLRIIKVTFPLIFVSTLFMTSWNIASIDPYGKNAETGPLYFVLVPLMLAYFLWGAGILLKYYKTAKDMNEKIQLRYIFTGFTLALIPAVTANGILPALGNDEAILYGPNSVIFIAIFTSIAIVKHGLLNIRLIVARSVGYLFSLGILLFIYIVVSNFVTNIVNELLPGTSFINQAISIVVLGILIISYTPLKRRFDKLSNKLFYQDSYDSQEFLDELNQVLVISTDTDVLLRKSAVIIAKYLKTEFCVFGLRETAYSPQRVIGTTDKHFSKEDIDEVRRHTVRIHHIVIAADDLPPEEESLRYHMQKGDVAVMTRLTPAVDLEVEGIGYILLGFKKSGNPFSKQDLKLLEIISNGLVVAIQNALRFEEIENFSETLQQKVDDATKKLKRANEKLKTMDETKDEFISMASHQLRTPLTSVKGYVSMVLEGDAGPLNDMQKKLLEQSFISSQRMVFLIADLLNLSRLKTGKFIIDAVPSNLADVIEGEVQQLKETAEAKGMTLNFHQPKSFPTLMLDETKIRQVIMNFVDNAIYYTPAGGKIDISLVENDKTVEFRVKDNGIGVPESEQHNLFNKFFRAKNAQKARPDGTGLGLFMAKKVIVAQGGALIFDSKVGKGSTFGFSFAKDKLAVEQASDE